jgi:hypothetical protein
MTDDAEHSGVDPQIELRAGRRYMLGIRGERYVIVDTQGGPEPVSSFPGTGEAREQAETEFRRLEREAAGGNRWWRHLPTVFAVALGAWVLSGLVMGVWQVLVAVDDSLASSYVTWLSWLQGVYTGGFVVWVGVLAILAFRWAWAHLGPHAGNS